MSLRWKQIKEVLESISLKDDFPVYVNEENYAVTAFILKKDGDVKENNTANVYLECPALTRFRGQNSLMRGVNAELKEKINELRKEIRKLKGKKKCGKKCGKTSK